MLIKITILAVLTLLAAWLGGTALFLWHNFHRGKQPQREASRRQAPPPGSTARLPYRHGQD